MEWVTKECPSCGMYHVKKGKFCSLECLYDDIVRRVKGWPLSRFFAKTIRYLMLE